MHSHLYQSAQFLEWDLAFFLTGHTGSRGKRKKRKKVHSQPNTAPAWAGGYTNPSQGNANPSQGNGMELDTVSPTRHGIASPTQHPLGLGDIPTRLSYYYLN
jgi:hypothetical protein